MINNLLQIEAMTKARTRTLFLYCALPLIFCLALPLHAFAKDAATPVEEGAKKTFNETVYEFIDSISTLSEDVKDVDLSVVKIVLYRPTRNQDEIAFPTNVVNIIEGKLRSKLLLTRRLQVFECLECKITHISLEKDKLVMSRDIDSNDRLRDLGKKLGVDGFMIWNLHEENKNIFLDLSIVKVSNGMVVWNNQYIMNPLTKKPDPGLAAQTLPKTDTSLNVQLSLSILGYSVTRVNDTLEEQASINRIIAENVTIMKKTSISDKISFGIGFSYFHNVVENQVIDVSGFYIYPMLEIQLGPYFEENTSMLNFYIAEGEAFFKKKESAVLLSGVKFNFTKELFMNVGFINIGKKILDMPSSDTGYEPTAEFGGPAYELKCGYTF